MRLDPRVSGAAAALLWTLLCLRWFDAAHLPHAWECGYLMEEATGTLLCGDLFTQGGSDLPPLTTSDILESSEVFRKPLDYFSHTRHVAQMELGI